MIAALISGSLFRAPEQRTAKSGRLFVSAAILLKEGEGTQFIRVAAFSESVQAALMLLKEGDALSIQGPLTASIYADADGNARISLSIVANNVLALRQPPKQRKLKAADMPDTRSRHERCAGSWQSPADGPNDDIPFGGAA